MHSLNEYLNECGLSEDDKAMVICRFENELESELSDWEIPDEDLLIAEVDEILGIKK